MGPVIGIYIFTVFGVTLGAGVDVLNAFPRKASAVVQAQLFRGEMAVRVRTSPRHIAEATVVVMIDHHLPEFQAPH